MNDTNTNIIQINQVLKWLLMITIIGVIAGTGSAILLASLNWVTDYREAHKWIIVLLPIAGFATGLLYHYYGKGITNGNQLLVASIQQPNGIIPFLMAPMIYISTILTHLFGGSAGREGTALQITASLTDQFSKPLKLSLEDRKIVVVAAIAAGFGAVFGTPIAGAIFALEFCLLKKFNAKIIIVTIASSVLGNCIAMLLNTKHTSYPMNEIPAFGFSKFLWVIVAGIAFGLCAVVFNIGIQKSTAFIKKQIVYPPFQPMIGGIIIALAVFLLDTTKYIGLGIPTILESFKTLLPYRDFILKMIFTILTLAAGFKGGEATPLFFIGAVLGNCLSSCIPLPFAFLSGMGFVAVFAGVMNTPFACTMMAIELFGMHAGVYAIICCLIAYGVVTIYKNIKEPKF